MLQITVMHLDGKECLEFRVFSFLKIFFSNILFLWAMAIDFNGHNFPDFLVSIS